MQLALDQENRAADLCKQCMGWCCYRFVIRMPYKKGDDEIYDKVPDAAKE